MEWHLLLLQRCKSVYCFLTEYTNLYRKYCDGKKKLFLMLMEISVWGPHSLKMALLQNACIKRWGDNYSIDFHRIRNKNIFK